MVMRGVKTRGVKRRRKTRQRRAKRYMELREECQLDGTLPTEPEGAIRDERVSPSSQSEQRLDVLDRRAVKEEWAVPAEAKPKVIARLLEPFYEEPKVVTDRDGREVVIPPDRYLMKENAKVLLLADRMQYERDHPELAAKAKGGGTVVNTRVNVVGAEFWDAMRDRLNRGGGVELRKAEIEEGGSHDDGEVQELGGQPDSSIGVGDSEH